jgi:hypothetical protein
MAGRSEVQKSPAYAALSVGGKRVFHVILERSGSGGSDQGRERLASSPDLASSCRCSMDLAAWREERSKSGGR